MKPNTGLLQTPPQAPNGNLSTQPRPFNPIPQRFPPAKATTGFPPQWTRTKYHSSFEKEKFLQIESDFLFTFCLIITLWITLLIFL